MTRTPHPLLVPWSRKGRAVPLLPLWAVRPVQSLSACTRVHCVHYAGETNFSVDGFSDEYLLSGLVLESTTIWRYFWCNDRSCHHAHEQDKKLWQDKILTHASVEVKSVPNMDNAMKIDFTITARRMLEKFAMAPNSYSLFQARNFTVCLYTGMYECFQRPIVGMGAWCRSVAISNSLSLWDILSIGVLCSNQRLH